MVEKELFVQPSCSHCTKAAIVNRELCSRPFAVDENSPVAGVNTAPFWIFVATSRGDRLVLTQSPHELTRRITRWKDYREIEASSKPAAGFYSAIFRFEGNRYVKRSERTEGLQ